MQAEVLVGKMRDRDTGEEKEVRQLTIQRGPVTFSATFDEEEAQTIGHALCDPPESMPAPDLVTPPGAEVWTPGSGPPPPVDHNGGSNHQ